MGRPGQEQVVGGVAVGSRGLLTASLWLMGERGVLGTMPTCPNVNPRLLRCYPCLVPIWRSVWPLLCVGGYSSTPRAG